MIPSSPGQRGGWRLHFWLHTSSLCSKADLEWAVVFWGRWRFRKHEVDNMFLVWMGVKKWKVSVVFDLGFALHDLKTRFTHHEAGRDLASSFSHFSRQFACNGDAFWTSVVNHHQANRHVSVGWSELIPAVVLVFQGKGFTPHWSNRRNFWLYHMVRFFVEPGSCAT